MTIQAIVACIVAVIVALVIIVSMLVCNEYAGHIKVIAIIAAIPMIIPSMVKKERILWDQMPLKDKRIFSNIICPL